MPNHKNIGDLTVDVNKIVSVCYAGGKPAAPPTPIMIYLDMGEWTQSHEIDSEKFPLEEVRGILFGRPPVAMPPHPWETPRVIKDIPQA